MVHRLQENPDFQKLIVEDFCEKECAGYAKASGDPSLSKEKFDSYKKVLVIAVLKDETGRRIAEDKLVAAFNTITTVQSYTYLTPVDTTQQIIEQKLKNDGFDGVLYMRLKEVEKSVTYNQGTGFHGGYGWYGGYHAPGYYSVDKTFVVETNLYDVAVNKLMWSTTTETINPKATSVRIIKIFFFINLVK